ncbi:ADP-ribosylglycohydrolase family protein [Deinococcus maricopensis]|uniref:ADP-ribosylation/Crystallin J1 n=1 Tax=Deinococcus maricopensis (strain DSM 21211 / LMG 22137 / NRRL B-23946 / LB-34) TaxID=709986 RepID=E8U644_DEIML|nr:ADP-ribosylglycohydrolase family protein [Deinococcus maricopensis]ADV66533.1 ADP-ribosylation/Crystallin J1 [Deinococcus maricopensis DSM 21211]
MTTPEQVRGVLYGSAYGDALAAPVEFERDVHRIRAQYADTLDLPAEARVTDDTQMMLAVARALLHAPTLTPSALEPHLRAEFIAWRHDPQNNRAPGITCLTACSHLERGGPWQAATVPGSKGCGANMRVQSVALLNADPDTRAGIAMLQAALTHGHPTALAASDLTQHALYTTLHGTAPRDLPDALLQYATERRHHYPHAWLGDLWTHTHDPSPDAYITRGWAECERVLTHLRAAAPRPLSPHLDPCDLTGEGWIAEEALATAALCYASANGDPHDTLTRARATRGDSDSIACIAGALLGAHHGHAAFPPDWADRIEYRDELTTLSDQYAALHT